MLVHEVAEESDPGVPAAPGKDPQVGAPSHECTHSRLGGGQYPRKLTQNEAGLRRGSATAALSQRVEGSKGEGGEVGSPRFAIASERPQPPPDRVFPARWP